MHYEDTIAAISTPPGYGGIGIIRVSGHAATGIAQQLTGIKPRPYHAHFTRFYDKDRHIIDEGLLLFFPTPKSFTGEDVVELHAHGSPVVLDLLLQCITQLGVRLAEPGEFSRRAFCNNKIDLAQAESIADLISSSATHAAQSAQRVLQGEFSAKIESFRTALTALQVQVESSLDFSEDSHDEHESNTLCNALSKLQEQVLVLIERGKQGALVMTGAEIAIVGRPNVGKSSLLNCLAQREEAIVSHLPGTTRDVLKCDLLICGIPVRVLDTAGMRKPQSGAEAEGIRRARAAIKQVNLVLLVLDATQTQYQKEQAWIKDWDKSDIPWLAIANKSDLRTSSAHDIPYDAVIVSAKTTAGIDTLSRNIAKRLGYDESIEDSLGARRRHITALQKAYLALEKAAHHAKINTTELLAEELRYAHQALGEITGEFTTEDLLGEIFSHFCIGK